MNPIEFLATLLQKNMELWVEGHELCYRAPKGLLTPALRAELIAHKPQITTFLGQDRRHVRCSFAQERLWSLHHLEPDGASYNLAFTLRIIGPLSKLGIEHSLEDIARRHEILRTTFRTVNGYPVQVIHPSVLWSMRHVDLQCLPATRRQNEINRICQEEARHPFDLVRGPLFRPLLFQFGEQEYVLLLPIHHIIFDGWSISVLARELSAFYSGFVAEQPVALQEPRIQYTDYVLWQHDQSHSLKLEKQLAFWKQQLSDAPPTVDLPFDHPRATSMHAQGGKQTSLLSPQLTMALKTLSHREGATLFITLFTVFNTLLYRYTNQTDIVIGVPIANRTLPETEGLIGCFINNLALRTDLSGNPSFHELLQRVRRIVLAAYDNQDLPFQKILEVLQPERATSYAPVFQILFVLQNTPTMAMSLAGLTIYPDEIDLGSSKYDIVCALEETPEGLQVFLDYNKALFEDQTIDRMLSHFTMLLRSVVAQPTMRISELPLLTEEEQSRQLAVWNDTARPYQQTLCVHDLFEARVRQSPDALAVSFQDEHITYNELNRRANQLANVLRGLGVKPEVTVCLLLDRSPELLIGILGILKAGGTYVPLDPTYPAERLAFMLENSQASVAVTRRHLAEDLPLTEVKVVYLDTDRALLGQQSEMDVTPTSPPADVAYIIYTSGSTGRPKGVPVLHHAIVNFLTSMRDQPGLSAQDTLLAVTTLSFDIAVLELFLPLTTGARVVIASRDVAADGERLAEALEFSGATVMQATPITWRLLLAAGWQGNPRLKILCGGEELPSSLARQILPKCLSLWNMYGPTETTIWSSVCKI
ncbi:MAG TPA: condensation domain-containing protein, partial [Ktedonobacteraceae bacterium]|nr:condensation domain-containing protein [Ktedonobacteraceae bacterium]